MAEFSPLAVDLKKRLESIGIEKAAFDWLLKALHPAGAASSTGMPDEVSVTCMRPEYRDQFVISVPTSVTTPTWDLCVWCPPGDTTVALYCAANAGAVFDEAAVPTGATTGAINCQSFTYARTVPSATFVGSAGPNFGNAYAASLSSAWRTQYSSVTAYMTASALNDQGTCFAGQFTSPPAYSEWSIASPGLSDSASNPVYLRPASFNVPLDENDMLLQNPKSWTGPARDGVYIPLRLTGPSQPWNPPIPPTGLCQTSGGDVYLSGVVAGQATLMGGANQVFVTPNNFVGGGVATGYSPSISMSFQNVLPLAPGSTTGYPVDTSYDAVRHGVIVFRGLSAAASITLKFFRGLEQRPLVDAPSRMYCRPPVKPSAVALQAYYAIANDMADCYPASFNSLGTILSAIGSVASRVWPTARKGLMAMMDAQDAPSARVTRGRSRGLEGTPLATQQRVTYDEPAPLRRRPASRVRSSIRSRSITSRGKPRRKRRGRG
jgi:hypothetical protein